MGIHFLKHQILLLDNLFVYMLLIEQNILAFLHMVFATCLVAPHTHIRPLRHTHFVSRMRHRGSCSVSGTCDPTLLVWWTHYVWSLHLGKAKAMTLKGHLHTQEDMEACLTIPCWYPPIICAGFKATWACFLSWRFFCSPAV